MRKEGQKLLLSAQIFKIFFQCRQGPVNGPGDLALVYSLGSGNFSFAHAQKIVGTESLGLFVRQGGNGCVKLLQRNLALIDLPGSNRQKQCIKSATSSETST